jgi:hypothetical protein
MPPYKPNKSKAQQRKMFALAEQGKISKTEAVGKARATESSYKKLPNKVKKGKKK